MFYLNCRELSPLFKEVLHTIEENTKPSHILCMMKMSEKNNIVPEMGTP